MGLSAGAAWSIRAASADGRAHAGAIDRPARRERARQVLIVLEQGGLSHIDTWDPKPDAVSEHRSPFKSIAFAGAGIRGGQVIGATDRDGGFIRDKPQTPHDYAATIYELLGMDRTRPVYTRDQRPVFLSGEGRPIRELI